MRKITLIIIHCSATPEGRNLDFEACRHDHIHHRGFSDIGYHFYITRNGEIHRGRPIEKMGAHCKNHNRHSVGICYEGGLSSGGVPTDTRTLEQKAATLLKLYLYGKSEKKINLEPHPQSNHRSGDRHRQRHRYTKLHLVGRDA